LKKFLPITILVILADRVTKILAESLPADGVTLLPGLLGLRRGMNTGIAFSLLSGHPRLLGIFSILIILIVCLCLRGRSLSRLAKTGLALMLGGALSNAWDRLFSGAVPDMIEFLFVRFAIFNVADAALVIGCVLLMIAVLTEKPKEENP